ncbi:Transcriptional regulator, MerR family [Leucobacter sp. 7(1)]|uniref:MerR family transcriptional regulator n=1 Tax=Leucobacter sp. 7(1) TaxID=1255613 RepID=UPI00097F4C8E|nr:MerR family transcriptional regulator [Leucobacter sp. 7(1)]SJN08087.1 Transcriptional regulator, MerR family [Leucobacter sp. 7(1)]
MEWTVQQLAERAGISARTIRHYHRIGLLLPDSVGSNGYRYYGAVAVARLQRILLLRDTGMPLADIAEALATDPSRPGAEDSEATEIAALETHLTRLAGEQRALERRVRAVEHTLEMRRAGREPHMDAMLDGFNDRFEDEVVRRWGREAFEASNQWWHGKSLSQQRAWQQRAETLLHTWAALHEAGFQPGSQAAQDHAAAHVAWFAEIPGTPTHAGDVTRSAAMVRGVAASYEADPSFQHHFGSPAAAHLAAESLRQRVSGWG